MKVGLTEDEYTRLVEIFNEEGRDGWKRIGVNSVEINLNYTGCVLYADLFTSPDRMSLDERERMTKLFEYLKEKK